MKAWWNLVAVVLAALLSVTPAWTAAVPDRLTPSDAELVVQVNVRQLLQTPLVKKHALDPLKALLEHSAETRRLLHAAGLDPFHDIDTISVSTSGRPLKGGKLLVVVCGSFSPDKVQTAADDYAKKHPGRIKTGKEGELSMWEIRGDDGSFYAAFADNKTLVMTATKDETVAVIRRAGQAPQQPSAAMQAALAHLKGGENMWLAMVATDEIKQLLKADDASKDFAAAMQSVTGALELSDDAQFGLEVHTNSTEAAAKLKARLDELMPLLSFLGAGKDRSGQLAKEVIDSIKLKTEQNDVSIRLHVTDAQIGKTRKKAP
ncbi:MAG TPA: hypothetical protein VH592_02075 [Gemmataceae bacterium]|jgi:hypothetical protein